MENISQIINSMTEYYAGDPRRINHFIKVHEFAKTIGELEGLDAHTLFTLEAAAVVHDIGIKLSEQKYGSSAGNYQELEGPPIAKKMLTELCIDAQVVERVCYLVGHHHTYGNIDGLDYRILVEADFLVNIYEENLSAAQAKMICNKYFKTKTGITLLNRMYPDN
ncbi:HD domain-containing protein [Acetanaerobacterium elongatum]|uniref:HD domain-containing protein n=1 Tax=Acetanaerobacterium elongatum TaxID=258515 RepID=A0A1H0B3I8_9FIRM|nr:HD domain-containing protein [Acetanaerobacterium elongatum]SDN40152.1 HD domain-containing protein [Acetanaerobacterium elongatum]